MGKGKENNQKIWHWSHFRNKRNEKKNEQLKIQSISDKSESTFCTEATTVKKHWNCV